MTYEYEIEIKPTEAMSDAADSIEGIEIVFEDETCLRKYRARCYMARIREERRLENLALVEECPIGLTGWEDLVFMPLEGPDGKKNKLYIGKASAKIYGILSISRINSDKEE